MSFEDVGNALVMAYGDGLLGDEDFLFLYDYSLQAGSRWSTESARRSRERKIEGRRILPAGSLLFATRACDSNVNLLAG